MRVLERELVEVVLEGLDLAVVAHLVAEPKERVLDRPADLGDRVEVPERQLLAGERDVDDLVAQAPVELGIRQLVRTGFERVLEPGADPVQEHAALTVAHTTKCLHQVGFAAQEATRASSSSASLRPRRSR